MPDDFQIELEKLVAHHARALAEDVTSLILGRLGVGRPAPSGAGPRKSSKRAVAKRAEASGAVPAPNGGKRRRASSGERGDAMERVASVVAGSEGVSAGEVERLTHLSRGQVVAALRALKESGRIFMAGDKRLARYGATRGIAERASQAARSKAK